MADLAWWTALSEILRNFGIILAGGLGLWFAWARVKAADRQAEAAHEQSVLARRDHVAELFNRAVGQLADERLEVRLGAVYTLRQIRRDFPDLAGAVFELLNAYIRQETAGRDLDSLPVDIKTILEVLDEQARERRDKGP
jgi:hypothetical protein